MMAWMPSSLELVGEVILNEIAVHPLVRRLQSPQFLFGSGRERRVTLTPSERRQAYRTRNA